MAAIDQIHVQGLWKTPELKAKLVRLHTQYGLTSTVLAERFGWNANDVTKILREAGCDLKRKKLTETEIDKMVELTEQGKTPHQIGAILDRAHGSVRTALKERGIEPARGKRGKLELQLPNSPYARGLIDSELETETADEWICNQ